MNNPAHLGFGFALKLTKDSDKSIKFRHRLISCPKKTADPHLGYRLSRKKDSKTLRLNKLAADRVTPEHRVEKLYSETITQYL